jgi:hypothetical protein
MFAALQACEENEHDTSSLKTRKEDDTMNAPIPFLRSIETISPFRHSRESRTAVPAKISGDIPLWLRDEVVRTCPAIFESGTWRAGHWFDGLGMIYAFRIANAAINFQSRLLALDNK